mmetsp:Transcript_32240/g.75789  ORF Transcript_32240/g.75789 Transcript_32240/m.75789 type:complete len:493 (+) Transcript_32240:154-1632(+)|eukprot:CAMPEP_0172399338 /NCGR_PEP_ID=MMETSP1061-20121228/40512_1 /TAXON_ID=37318 /ORGANISM="Pseudo-nitzschia pungens, Strain cf. pungens" /LENGTH=492 /DNA_ID=CAMNT_0013132195 /DNA_START=151 /DNA_END=1629 /DNA_ORIENTATION=-
MTLQEGGNCSSASPLVDWDQPYTPYRNNAEKVLKLRIDIDGETTTAASINTRNEQIQEIVEILCPFLGNPNNDSNGDCDPPTPRQCFEIKPLTGGLSNHLFLISNDAKTVLVRIHPDDDDDDDDERKNGNETANANANGNGTVGFSFVDRESEPKFAVWLASHKDKLAPTVYGRFLNGRVEEFYANVRPLSCVEMKFYAPWIAQRMAAFHALEAPPLDVLPRPAKAATLYETVASWLSEAQATGHENESERIGDDEFLRDLSTEWAWLEKELTSPPQQTAAKCQKANDDNDRSIAAEALEFIRRVAVTHMDCQPLNILIDVENNDNHGGNEEAVGAADVARGSNRLRLIDYEYAGWNPVAADIANTFCEYCEMTNLCADFDNEYPTPVQQNVFLWNYLMHLDPLRAKRFSSYPSRNPESNNNDQIAAEDKEWDIFSATLQQEIGRFSLLSHLGWAIWSVVKAREEDCIDFDYMAYARHRMEGYAWAKKRFIV